MHDREVVLLDAGPPATRRRVADRRRSSRQLAAPGAANRIPESGPSGGRGSTRTRNPPVRAAACEASQGLDQDGVSRRSAQVVWRRTSAIDVAATSRQLARRARAGDTRCERRPRARADGSHPGSSRPFGYSGRTTPSSGRHRPPLRHPRWSVALAWSTQHSSGLTPRKRQHGRLTRVSNAYQ